MLKHKLLKIFFWKKITTHTHMYAHKHASLEFNNFYFAIIYIIWVFVCLYDFVYNNVLEWLI